MSYFYLGAYWPADRPLTLRQYADATRSFLAQLQGVHPAFRTLEWVGDRPNSAVHLLPDLSNLDDLIYRHAGRDAIYRDTNADGTPSWKSTGILGYSMDYCTGKSAQAGGISIGVTAGCHGIPTPNAISIGFPPPEDTRFPHREFHDHAFLRVLFCKVITLWAPKYGRVTSHAFAEAVSGDARPHVGWLTYLRDPRAAALRNAEALRGLVFESTPDGGTLISLDQAIIRPDNMAQVERARQLRSKLIAEKLV